MLDAWEILFDPPFSMRAARFLNAMIGTRPPGAAIAETYSGTRRLLMMYGPGSPARLAIMRQHLAAGGRVAAWDMGYWDRKLAMRLSIDGLHPTPAQMEASPATQRRAFVLREDADQAGPILLVGLGVKSLSAYGIVGPLAWEREQITALRRRFPGAEIRWRPKTEHEPAPDGLQQVRGEIEEALRGCSLVRCRHSNVAVDACVAGIPVWCDDGAAQALYFADPAPGPEQRLGFLSRLSWWNWRVDEAAAAWAHIQGVTQ